ncbi:MAG: PAS domain S-box protein [Desulfuromonadales bacterium]|nr:PAS domain S-box protein [Desulfuromonadales bacterium]
MDVRDEQEIRQLFDDYLRMYSSRDDQLVDFFSADFSGFTGGGDFLVKDRDAWVAITRQDFAQVKHPLRIELIDLSVQSLAETVAVATGFFHIHLPIEDLVLSRETARLVLIFRQEPVGWKICHSSISIPYNLVCEGEVYPLQKLEESHRILEEQVAERTRQLSEVNATLQQVNERLAHEIAEHKKSEEALQESKDHFRIMADNVSDVVWKLDQDYRFTYISPSDERLRGYRADEVLGQHIFDFFDEDGIATVKKFAYQRQQAELQGIKNGSIMFEAFHRCKDGNWVCGEVSATPERDADGTVIGYYGISREITERKQAESELRKLEKLESLGVLAGGIAHDFNNVLTGLYGNIALAKMKLANDHSGFRFLEAAEQSMLRTTLLTNRLLTFAKGGDPVTENISLVSLIEEVVNLSLSGSNVKPVITSVTNLWQVRVDQRQIQQVFANLTINAREAMSGGGLLTIAMENAELADKTEHGLIGGKYLQITVTDEGTGIEHKLLDKIFDPYFTTKEMGSGLGLATAYSIIDKHGGHIRVTSRLGKGTTFAIYLPATEVVEETPLTQPGVAQMPLTQGAKILVMDDEEMIRNMLNEMLGELGFAVETAAEGQQAIDMYQQAMDTGKSFAIVILDLTIPGGMGGQEAAKGILQIDPEVKMIVSSGYADDPIIVSYTDHGFKGVAKKPYSMNELAGVLDQIIEKG